MVLDNISSVHSRTKKITLGSSEYSNQRLREARKIWAGIPRRRRRCSSATSFVREVENTTRGWKGFKADGVREDGFSRELSAMFRVRESQVKGLGKWVKKGGFHSSFEVISELIWLTFQVLETWLTQRPERASLLERFILSITLSSIFHKRGSIAIPQLA